jgi:hypothetical protein
MPGYRGGSAAQGTGATATVAVPSAAEAGDMLVLFLSRGANEAIATPAGWAPLGTARQASSLTTAAFSRAAQAGDAGSNVSVTLTSSGKWAAHLVAYSDCGAVEAAASSMRTTSATTVVTPIVTTSVTGRWLLEHVAVKASPVGVAWTAPAADVKRLETFQTGSGALAVGTGDNGPEAAGDLGNGTWTHDVSTGQATAWSLALAPGTTLANAGADQTVDGGLTVTLDGASSSPAGGTYSWTQLSGTSVTITGPTTAAPTFPSPVLAGGDTLVFQLQYTANAVAATDTVTVVVNPSSAASSLFFHEDYEGGANGVEVTTTNSDWDTATGTGAVFDSSWSAAGGKSARHTGGKVLRETIPSPGNDLWIRFRWKASAAAPSANSSLAVVRAAAAAVADLRHNTTGKLQMRDGVTAVGAESAAIGANEELDIEWHLDAAGNTQDLALYRGANKNGTVPSETIAAGASSFTGTTPDDLGVFKVNNTTSWDWNADEVRASKTGPCGPLTAAPAGPVANAGADQSVRSFQTVTLDGSASTPDATYGWAQTGGSPTVVLAGTGAKRTFVAPRLVAGTTLTFTLTVTVGTQQATDTVVITVARHRRWMRTSSGFTIALRTRTAVLGQPPPPPVGSVMLIASTQPPPTDLRLCRLNIDTLLAQAISRSRPLLSGSHVYSGASFPATFAASNAATDPGDGWHHSLLNVKIADTEWAAAGGGTWDAHLTAFVQSIPVGHTVYLVVNHEPENDHADTAATTWGPAWCAMQRRLAKVVADLNDPRCQYAITHMAYTWFTATRNPDDWDFTSSGGTMPQYVKDRTIVAPDGYTSMTASGGVNYSISARFDPVLNYFRGKGMTKFGVAEHAFNNDAGASPEAVAAVITGQLHPFITANGLIFYAYYDSTGPAAGTNAFLDSAAERLAYAQMVETLTGTA